MDRKKKTLKRFLVHFGHRDFGSLLCKFYEAHNATAMDVL